MKNARWSVCLLAAVAVSLSLCVAGTPSGPGEHPELRSQGVFGPAEVNGHELYRPTLTLETFARQLLVMGEYPVKRVQ